MKSKPQGLVLKKFFKTLRQKKVILVIVLVLLTATAVFLLTPQKDNSIKLVLTSEGAGFKANFSFPYNKRSDIERFLGSVNVPSALLDGVEFELESTASSALAFALPVEADLKIQEKEIAFSGFHTYPHIAKVDIEKFKLSPDTNLAIFTQSAKEFIKNSQSLPSEFSGWLDENLNSKKGYYISVFGKEPSLLIIFQPERLDTDSLEGLKLTETEDSSYKKERFGNDVDVHFVKLTDDENLSAAIFEKDGWAYLIISQESPQEAIDIYMGESSDFVEFPNINDQSATFVSWFRNTGNYTAAREFYRLLLGQNLESTEALEKIEEVRFSLLGSAFSGLIKFK